MKSIFLPKISMLFRIINIFKYRKKLFIFTILLPFILTVLPIHYLSYIFSIFENFLSFLYLTKVIVYIIYNCRYYLVGRDCFRSLMLGPQYKKGLAITAVELLHVSPELLYISRRGMCTPLWKTLCRTSSYVMRS